MNFKKLLQLAVPLVFAATSAFAAEKPEKLHIGITAFLSGPAAVFGVPAKAAAEMMIEDINEAGGIGGVPLSATFIDEGAGGEALLAEYRRLVQDEGVDAMFASISSGNCNKIAPLADDLKILNIMWDCGTQRIFEENDYRYVFRTQSNATPEMLSAVLYLLKTKPDFKTIAVVNQDYSWGRDSWEIFSTALKTLKPDVEVVAEFFPKFGSPDFSTEISRLLALRPDVILSTSWGGDLDTFVRQASQRGLTNNSTLVLPLAESSLERLGDALPSGQIVGTRGDHYFLHPEKLSDPAFTGFVEEFKDATGSYPIYPVYHMSQALNAFKGAYEKAMEANGGEWPDKEQVVDAMTGLTFVGLGREVTIREDGQGVEDQLLGTTVNSDDYDFATLGQIMIFDGDQITTPVGKVSADWLKALNPDFIDAVNVDTFEQ
ncbi:ABC transporter substrate-binding protein [Hoeflea prorocentri]|uniref:ABC transporter substrate-binding protein n=1 Tax=Hoeflea prorocentri TaxID=1922333 RepID=A0A9X3ZGC4_9HYPH|nr:ABC transporter substrate-binding protein [Hoeflea prorocentri]MCY6379636.1 ABC transporter substrate-binding protein [Hoeflea prorocentri]MDA5397436.1 ABC transporter substrate-binding protein [Hoeflea prorocentri]